MEGNRESSMGVGFLPEQALRESTSEGISYNLLLAGSGFTGKSSFIQALLGMQERGEQSVESSGMRDEGFFHEVCDMFCTNNPLALLLEESVSASPEHLKLSVYATRVSVLESEFCARCTLYEVGGIGDSSSGGYDWIPIRNMILNRFEEHHIMEERGIEGADKRIHACVYFLDRVIREIDVKSMKEIGRVCNLVPVVSRADSYTEEEFREMKEEMSRIICEEGLNLFEWVPVGESKKVVELNFFPMRLITGGVAVQRSGEEGEGGDCVVRDYGWGRVLAKDDSSDLGRVRDILIRTNTVDLFEMCEKYYEDYRKNKMIIDILTNPGKGGINENIRRSILLEESNLKKQMKRIREKKVAYEKTFRKSGLLSSYETHQGPLLTGTDRATVKPSL
jgi:septin 7